MVSIKEAAIKLRQNGYSYRMINQKLGVPKSTLSNWLTNIEFVPNEEVVKRIGDARLKTALHKQKSKFNDIARRKKEAIQEIDLLSNRDLLMLGTGLYLGEGSKAIEEVRIANADPNIIRISMKWFEEVCNINRRHFRITIHSYPDNNHNEIIDFWSKITNLPREQFTKIVIDYRKNKSASKKRRLPHGTAQLYIRSGGTLIPGVKSTHRKIMGWIEAINKQI